MFGTSQVLPKSDIVTLQRDEFLTLMFDDFNSSDPQAVAVRTSGERDRMMIGYVPRYFTHEVRQLCKKCHPKFIDLRVERVNPNALLQQHLLCRMHACWPNQFSPCLDEDFQPLAKELPSIAK